MLDIHKKAVNLLQELDPAEKEALYEAIKHGYDVYHDAVPEMYHNLFIDELKRLLDDVA